MLSPYRPRHARSRTLAGLLKAACGPLSASDVLFAVLAAAAGLTAALVLGALAARPFT